MGERLNIKNIEENVVACVRPKADDAVYTEDWEDLQVYMRIIIDSERSMALSKAFFDTLAIDAHELMKKAISNLREQVRIRPLADVLRECGVEEEEAAPIMVASTKKEQYGAGAILVMNEHVKDKWILPCSVHEVLLVDKDLPEADLRSMIVAINMSGALEPQDVLSDHPYDVDSLASFAGGAA